jgi:adenylosuccinate synthase
MTLTVVLGGQWGSEGKGKVSGHILEQASVPIHVARTGGPNAGHTIPINGERQIFRQLSAGVSKDDGTCYIGAGSVVNLDVLKEEIERAGISKDRVIVDNRAVILDDDALSNEVEIKTTIGSTGSGVGQGFIRRMERNPDTCRLVEHLNGEVVPFTAGVVSDLLRVALSEGDEVLLEGSQGFGLSIFHGNSWPFCTSRDTTTAGILSETGLSWKDLDEVVVVFRTYPIRVGGNSGPMGEEIDWETVAEEGGAPEVEDEWTSVTKKLRRVSYFDPAMALKAVQMNGATSIAMMGLDRLDYGCRDATRFADLTPKVKEWLQNLETVLGVPVKYAGTAPDVIFDV